MIVMGVAVMIVFMLCAIVSTVYLLWIVLKNYFSNNPTNSTSTYTYIIDDDNNETEFERNLRKYGDEYHY